MLSLFTSILPSGMNYQLIRVLLALVETGVLSYFDLFKNRNIPDKLLYGFLALSLIFLIIDPQTVIPSLFWAVVIGVVGYLFYKAGQLGAADVILFVSLSILLPAPPNLFTTQFIQIPFILSLIILSGLLLILYILLRYAPTLIKMTIEGKVRLTTDKIFYSIALFIMYIIVSYILLDVGMGNPFPFILLLGYIMIATIFVNLFKDDLTKLMTDEIDLSNKNDLKKIGPEDIVATDLMDKKYVKKHNIPKLLTDKDIKRLAKEKVKLLVMTRLPPYIPFILLALLVEILLGDPLYYIISSLFFSIY